MSPLFLLAVWCLENPWLVLEERGGRDAESNATFLEEFAECEATEDVTKFRNQRFIGVSGSPEVSNHPVPKPGLFPEPERLVGGGYQVSEDPWPCLLIKARNAIQGNPRSDSRPQNRTSAGANYEIETLADVERIPHLGFREAFRKFSQNCGCVEAAHSAAVECEDVER